MRSISQNELVNISGGMFGYQSTATTDVEWMHNEAKHDGIMAAGMVGIIAGYVFLTHSPTYATAFWGTAALTAAAYIYGYESSDIWPWNF